jgi:hypothetical protein
LQRPSIRRHLCTRACRWFDPGYTVVCEKLDHLYGDDPAAGRLDPAVEYFQNLSLQPEDW